MGSFDTNAFGVLLGMKVRFLRDFQLSFMLSSQPQAGVSKHATRPFLPAHKGLSQSRRW
jgi:hypothetical protein